MHIFTKAARFYNQKVFPKVRSLRGTNFISRNLSKMALRSLSKSEKIKVGGLTISEEIHGLNSKVAMKIVGGNYELDEVRTIENMDFDGKDVIELGGRIGYISCVIDSKLSDSNKHIVLEPNPKVNEILRRNKSLNNAGFEILDGAYSSKGEKVELSVEDKEVFWSGSTNYESATDQDYLVEGYSLRNIIEKFDLDEFVLISDIEGAEYEIVANELELLSKNCSDALIEFHMKRGNNGPHRAIKELESKDFKLCGERGKVYRFNNTSQI